MEYHVKNYFTDETISVTPDLETAKRTANESDDRVVTDNEGYVLYWNVILPF